uniref:Uncharacterized protein n=1 Tax=Odontella aurita TaxID=265563 RepID=A0A7S4MRM7_9STRA
MNKTLARLVIHKNVVDSWVSGNSILVDESDPSAIKPGLDGARLECSDSCALDKSLEGVFFIRNMVKDDSCDHFLQGYLSTISQFSQRIDKVRKNGVLVVSIVFLVA